VEARTQEVRVSTSSPSQWGRVLAIEFPRARFDAERARVVRDLRKRVSRPGFRKGHVPTALLEREFAGRIDSDTVEKLLPAVCDEVIQGEKLDVLSTPRVRNLVLTDPEVVRFELSLEVRPTIRLGSFDGLRGTRWLPDVTDADVDKAIAALREEAAHFESVEREARDGDYVQVAYVPLDAEGRERTAHKVENYPFQLGAGNVVAEFESAVRGLVPGATARAEVRYAQDHEQAEFAGKVVPFLLTLKAVKEKRVPEVDEAFATDLGAESLDALRTGVRADLGRRLADESERELRESLVDWILAANPFEAPETMVENYLEAALADYDQGYRRLGLQPDPDRRGEFATGIRPAAVRGVRRMLLLEQLIEQQGIAVTEPDVDRWIEDRVQAGGPDPGKVRAFWADARNRRRLKNELTEERVFAFLKSKAEIATVPRLPPPPGA